MPEARMRALFDTVVAKIISLARSVLEVWHT